MQIESHAPICGGTAPLLAGGDAPYAGDLLGLGKEVVLLKC